MRLRKVTQLQKPGGLHFVGEPRTLNPVCRVDVQTVPGCLADSLFSCVVVCRVRLLRIQPQTSTSRSGSGAEILQGPI